MTHIERILCPIDFAPSTSSLLEEVADLARQLGAELHLLHVFENTYYNIPAGIDASAGYPGALLDADRRYKEQLRQQLEEAAAPYAEGDLTVHTRLSEGRAAETIVAIADEEKFGLIAMGTHGRTGVQHLLIGSVAERVVRTAHCPVLTIRLH